MGDCNRKALYKLNRKLTYMYPSTPGEKPDAEGRTHFVMHWYVTYGLGRSGKEAGWRGQHFFARMSEYVHKADRKPAVILASEDAFDALRMEAAING